MPAFTFVHAADFHLESPFVGIRKLPDDHGRVVQDLREATFKAFDAVIDLCIDRQVAFLLVAGDVYDGADRSLRAQLRFRNGLSRLAEHGVRAYVVHGNHDPLDGWTDSLEFPDTVHIFGDQLRSVVFEKEGTPVARIHGVSYPSQRIDDSFGKGISREGSEPFQIGLLHCNAGGNTQHEPYAPRTVNELVEAKLDYWALGHIHERTVIRVDNPFIGYPGNTQGRHINETGPRGCLLVSVTTDGRLEEEPEFVATDTVRWLLGEVDIAGIESMDQLLNSIDEEIENLSLEADGRPVVARITLEGRGSIHHALSRPDTAAQLRDELRSRDTQRNPFVWIESLVLRTRPDMDLAARRNAQDFVGDLLRLINEIRQSPEELGRLSHVLTELYDHGRASKILNPLKEDDIRTILYEAEYRCADLLLEEDN